MSTGLVDYVSSSSEGEGEGEANDHRTKRRRISESHSTGSLDGKGALPALPDGFRDLYAVVPRVSTKDDASLHQGRKRATPHMEGNWPTHIYLECKWDTSQARHKASSYRNSLKRATEFAFTK